MTKSPRELAADRGEHIYHTGEPCPAGHNLGRYTRSGKCIECAKQASERNRRRYVEKMDAAKVGGS